ncbi:MAG: RNase adapter RapZ [Deltaproteobacteria bacterium]|nr:RNase adapter RapZ [Deltaproteobacteria bacterium]
MKLSALLVTGQSGSGKTTAVRALEDHGYFCVDNMPLALVEQLITLLKSESGVNRLAFVIDIRERNSIQNVPQVVTRLRQNGTALRVFYLDAKEEAIMRRYSETRRRHPLDDGCGLGVAIEREREILKPLSELADNTLDTSLMSPHALRNRIIEQFTDFNASDRLTISLLSFGFKHGLPAEADIVLDVRFLPNPYFEPTLRERTGLDNEVARYALSSKEAEDFLNRTVNYLSFLIPQYQREGKRYLTVAIGCTGGRHRSVASVCELKQRLKTVMPINCRHRDI